MRLKVMLHALRRLAATTAATSALTAAVPEAWADGQTSKFVLPAVNKNDLSRCKFKSSAMGQANAARDKLYDLRFCDMSKLSADGFDLSGAILSEADFSGTSFKESQLSKAYAKNAKFSSADFTNAVVDRVTFEGANLKNALFVNTVLTGTTFDDADVEGADFSEAFIGDFELRKLCKNPTLKGENPTTGAPTRESAGCGG